MWDKIREINSMRKKIILTTLIPVLLVFFLNFQAQSEPKKISLVGQVVNGTFDNKPVADQEVELHIYVDNQEITDAAQKAKTDKNGFFRFTQLDSESGFIYSTLSIYKNVEYYGPALDDLEKNQVKNYQIVVNESTSVDPGIFESMHHYIIDSQDKFLNINEIIILKNDSKESFIGDEQIDRDRRRVISFSLPKNLENFVINDGLMECCVVFKNGTLNNTMALPPGIKQISFSYGVPLKSSEYSFQKVLDYDVETMSVFLMSQRMGLQSKVLENKGPFVIKDQTYYRYAVRNLKKGEHLEFKLSNLPYFKSYAPFFFALGIMLAVAVALAWRRYTRIKEESDPLKDESARLEAKKERIFEEIESITLDLDKKGISKKQYDQKYSHLKSELVTLYNKQRQDPR